MEYERIEKHTPQGGGFSPRKLRAMLLGVEKKRMADEDQLESSFSLQLDPGASSAGEFKDVSVVSSVQECSTSVKSHDNHNAAISAARSLEEDPTGFEFHKARSALMPGFSKPAPSKWDDAQKWIASPNSNRVSKPKKSGRQSVTRVVMEVVEDVSDRRTDSSEIKREIGGEKGDKWVSEPHPTSDSCVKSALLVENSISQSCAVNLNRYASTTADQSSTTLITPPSTVISVSMRDMGTEMTPIASQEPSRTGTPIRASTPLRSPSSSQPTTPRRVPHSSVTTWSADCHAYDERELSEKELQLKTRREIMMLGTQLGKTNIAAWASKENEEKSTPCSFQTLPVDQPSRDGIQSRAATAWEEAEKAKYFARFKEEEIKIQAWENHQKAKSEAEIRKIEVEMERMKTRAHDKLMSKLNDMKHKADEKRAVAEAKRNQQASRTAQQVDYIRRTGHIPSSYFCWSCCF